MPQVVARAYDSFGGYPCGLPRAYNLHGVTTEIGLFGAICDDWMEVLQTVTDSRVSKRLTKANGGQEVLKLYGKDARTCSRGGCELGPSLGVKVCAGCTGNDDSPKAHYCSRGCQKADWPAHKLVCAGSKRPKVHAAMSDEPGKDALTSDAPMSPATARDPAHAAQG